MSRRRATLYSPASANQRLFVSDAQGGVSHSDDGGETWTRKTVASAPTLIFDLARGQDGVICAVGYNSGSPQKIMRSTDDGESYSLVDISTGSSVYGRSIFTDGEGKWFAQWDNGTDDLYGSTDNGATWAKVADLGTGGTYARWAGAYANGLYIIAAKGNNYWTSTNGTSWTRRTDMGTTLPCYRLKYLNDLWFACCGSGAGSVLCYSATGTGSWTAVALGGSKSARDIDWDGTYYYIAGLGNTYGQGGIQRTSDLTTFTEVKALTGYTFWGIKVLEGGRIVASVGKDVDITGIVYTSDNQGATWSNRLQQTDYNYTRLA